VTGALSIDEYALLDFFGTLPVQRDEDVPWVYNDSAYEVTSGETQVSFALAPADRDVRVLLRVRGVLVYELDAMGVDDVKYHNDKGRESLQVIISQRQSIWLRVKPEISLAERISES